MEQNPYEAPRELGYIPAEPIANAILGMRRGFALGAVIISFAIISIVAVGCVFVVAAND